MSACRLYLITPPVLDDVGGFVERTLKPALDAGDVACLQLRLKNCPDDRLSRAAELMRPAVQDRDVAFLINDRPDVAAATGADGVHVGQGDTPYAEARAIVGTGGIVGVTCHASRDLAFDAAEGGADYVAFGAFFPTTTKDAPTRADPEIIEAWARFATTPCVAIGGVTASNCAPLVEAGADFLAVSSYVWGHPGGAGAGVRAMNRAIREASA